MPNFKFELWDIENGVVVTRPVVAGKDEETGAPIIKNSSVWRDDGLLACKELEVALATVKAEYAKKLQKR